MVDGGGAQLDGELDAGTFAELVAVHAGNQSRRDARASSTARAWSRSNAPVSQNTSIHLACGAQACDHLVAHHRDVVVDAARVLGWRHVGGEQCDLVGARRRDLVRCAARPSTDCP